MVAFRFLQGAFGAVLVAISQSILLDAFLFRSGRSRAQAELWHIASLEEDNTRSPDSNGILLHDSGSVVHAHLAVGREGFSLHEHCS